MKWRHVVLLFFLNLESFAQNSWIIELYQKLTTSFGEARNPPELKVTEGKSNLIAQYTPSPEPTIIIDRQVLNICREFGADSMNALAVILSHELAHFYRRHDWCGEFAFAVRGTALSQNLKNASTTSRTAFESQADVDGLFNACLSGYRPFGVYPKLLAKIYDAYKRPDKIPNYPTKQERIEAAKAAEQQATEGYAVFITANTWLQLGEYEIAMQHYDWLLKKFPSREIFNNAGVAQLLQVFSLKGRHEVPFIYPVELDSRSRLFTPNTRSGLEDNDRKIEVLLKMAQRNFEEAIRKDPTYSPAYVHLACIYSLLENQEAAIGKINELQGVQSLPAEALTIRGIAYFYNEQPTKAFRDLEEASKLRAKGGMYNLTLARKGLEFVKNASEIVEWLESNNNSLDAPPKNNLKEAELSPLIQPTILLSITPTITVRAKVSASAEEFESKYNNKVLRIKKVDSVWQYQLH